MERLTYAALKYSTIARGRIVEIDTAAAEAAPGVVLVMTHRNAPKLNKAPPFMSKPKAAGPDDLPIMQDDRIHWNGQPVAHRARRDARTGRPRAEPDPRHL